MLSLGWRQKSASALRNGSPFKDTLQKFQKGSRKKGGFEREEAAKAPRGKSCSEEIGGRWKNPRDAHETNRRENLKGCKKGTFR